MKKNLITAISMTVVTTVLLGVIYPLIVTSIAQVLFHDKANGQLISRNGEVIGSKIIGQPFTSAAYFHPRPSAAGNGYDAASSGGSNLGPTNRKLLDRVEADTEALHAENPAAPVPVDLVTTSASGLDPDITPAGADFQVARVARERGTSEGNIRLLLRQSTNARQLGFLGEPRVNVLQLNLALDAAYPTAKGSRQ